MAVTYKMPPQCSRQLGVANADTIAVALAAGCLCSKIGDVQQAEKLLRQAYTASKAAAEARVMQFFHRRLVMFGDERGLLMRLCSRAKARQCRWSASVGQLIRCTPRKLLLRELTTATPGGVD
jgi:hypothetical protein